MSFIEHVAVLGAGNMSHGIPRSSPSAATMSGRTTSTEMPRPTATSEPSGASRKLAEKGQLDEPREEVLARVDPRTDLKRAVAGADLVVEAAPEKLSARRNLFSTVDEHAPDHVILTSNTSSLSISDIAATTTRSEQVAGAHFFNLPVNMAPSRSFTATRRPTNPPKSSTISYNRPGRPRSTFRRTCRNSSSTPYRARSSWNQREWCPTADRRSARTERQSSRASEPSTPVMGDNRPTYPAAASPDHGTRPFLKTNQQDNGRWATELRESAASVRPARRVWRCPGRSRYT